MKKLSLQLIISILFVTGFTIAQTSTIKMNEIYSNGKSTTHPDLDWIELYNSSNQEVNISGYKIYDSGGKNDANKKMILASGSIIPAKGFFVVVTDIDKSLNGFGLSSGGEEVWLEDAAGTLIDNVTFPSMTETQAYGREFNGSTWKLLSTITKGLSNSVIVMNEIYSNGKSTTHPDLDWIELYNSSNAVVDISGYKIYDSGGKNDPKKKMVIAPGTSIPANGFYVVTTDVDKSLNGFGLSSNGEEVWLEDNNGNLIDNVTFPALKETETFSRIPDAGNWKLVTGLTKEKTNGTGTSVEKVDEIATDYKLLQNYPNPFNPSTVISYTLTAGRNTTLIVFDMLGREVATLVNEYQDPGSYKVTFDTRNINHNGNILSSGIYFYQLKSGAYNITKKMLLMK